jgi:hypothetical protein
VGRDLNPEPPEAGVLTTPPRHVVGWQDTSHRQDEKYQCFIPDHTAVTVTVTSQCL